MRSAASLTTLKNFKVFAMHIA
ncbi:hypothetical protein ACFQ5B_14560, partial [Laceyella putida]